MASVEHKSPVRRSDRSRTSTVIHINGHTIKKDNNYVLKGLTYRYGAFPEGDKKPLQATSGNIKKHKATPHDLLPVVAKKPRVVSTEERNRLQLKDRVDQQRRSKQAARLQFLQKHVSVLEPFCEPKVIHNLMMQSPPPPPQVSTDPKELTRRSAATIPTPVGITAELRDYQRKGLEWMSYMYSKNCGMILGDEMGLGKTLQTISLVCHLKEVWGCRGPSLVVCPLSVLNSWQTEIPKWAPQLTYSKVHVTDTTTAHTEPPTHFEFSSYDLVITTYEMIKVPALRHVWARHHFQLVVLDEGHRIKGKETQISQAVRKLHGECRLLLTGTPLANNLVELYSLLSFLYPDLFTTPTPFEQAFDLTNNQVNAKTLEQAHKLLEVVMLRRLKNEVEKLMPPKIETKVLVPLSNTQIWWYKSLLLKDISLLANAGMVSGKARMLSNLIMQLRKCCAHPFLFPGTEDNPDDTTLHELVSASGKVAVLDLLLQSLYQKGHRVVLFSQFTRVLDILDDYCRLRGWDYCRFDGGTSRAKRNYIVNSFNAQGSNKFLFLMSTRSGGMGLNLQTADTCILFDSDWNPQPDCQAMARVHRIGQTKTVHVYRLVCEGTIEERIVERAEKKLYLEQMVTRDGAASQDLGNDEEDAGRLLSALRFGCNAVFGDSQKNTLPTQADIEVLTDRTRTEAFSSGKLKGGMDSSAQDFDATKAMTSTTSFAGIDFKKIREAHQARPKDMAQIQSVWTKRQRKSRIKLVQAENTGWGSKAVPILASNDYDLETGERSVFAQELRGHAASQPSKRQKQKPTFENQDFCQVCGDGGSLVCCPRCPVSVHLECLGLKRAKDFVCCPHHHCSQCGKASHNAGGMLFPCACCPNAYCEDHLPPSSEVRFLDSCERMEDLGFSIDRGVYIHCSHQCERVAVKEYGWVPPERQTKVRAPCPAPLDLSESFGGKVDEFVDVPDNLVVQGKRNRKPVTYKSNPSSNDQVSNKAPVAAPQVSAVVRSDSLQAPGRIVSMESTNSSTASDSLQAPGRIVSMGSTHSSTASDSLQAPGRIVSMGSTHSSTASVSLQAPRRIVSMESTNSSTATEDDDDEVVVIGVKKAPKQYPVFGLQRATASAI